MRAERVEDLVPVAFHDRIPPIERKIDPVIRQATLREVVGPDPLAAVARADLLAPRRADGALLVLLRLLDKARLEDLHRLVAVLVLRALVLALDDDARRLVQDAHGRVGGVD